MGEMHSLFFGGDINDNRISIIWVLLQLKISLENGENWRNSVTMSLTDAESSVWQIWMKVAEKFVCPLEAGYRGKNDRVAIDMFTILIRSEKDLNYEKQ